MLKKKYKLKPLQKVNNTANQSNGNAKQLHKRNKCRKMDDVFEKFNLNLSNLFIAALLNFNIRSYPWFFLVFSYSHFSTRIFQSESNPLYVAKDNFIDGNWAP